MHLVRIFFLSVSHRCNCPAKMSFTEEIPDENKSERAAQIMSGGCNQCEHAAPICINIHWAQVTCTERWVWHILDVLASVRLCRVSGSLLWHPSIILMWFSCLHSELYDTDLVMESNCTGHLCMSSSHLPRLPKLTAGSLTYIRWDEIQKFWKTSSFFDEKKIYCHHRCLPQCKCM